MTKAILTLDIGNTRTHAGVFRLGKKPVLIESWAIPSQPKNPSAFVKALRNKLTARRLHGAQAAMIASVVPSLEKPVSALLRVKGITPTFLKSSAGTHLQNRYRSPSTLGADRLANARAALALHKGSSVVIDVGTATTFDCVSRRGEFLGGLIIPGPALMAQALHRYTARLPLVSLPSLSLSSQASQASRAPQEPLIGRTTRESIVAGLTYGYSHMISSLASTLRKKLGPGTKIFLTGGAAPSLKTFPLSSSPSRSSLGSIQRIPHLTLLGLCHFGLDKGLIKNK